MSDYSKNQSIKQTSPDPWCSQILVEEDPMRGDPVRGGALVGSSLSNPHIGTRPSNPPLAKVQLWLTGSKVKVSKPPLPPNPEHSYGRRGTINGFSKASRHRMMSDLNGIDKSGILPDFLTLTYGEQYPDNMAEVKQHLKRFDHRISRLYPHFAGKWKLEDQKRGAPHYHLLVWGLDGMDGRVLMDIVNIWHDIAGYGDPNHRLFHLGLLKGSKPCWSHCKNWRQVMAYVSKYLAKVTDGGGWERPGRFWGTLHREGIPYSEIRTIALSSKDAANFMRYLIRRSNVAVYVEDGITHYSRKHRIRKRSYQTFEGWMDNPQRWQDLLLSPEFLTEHPENQ